MNEFTIALEDNKPIGILTGTGGTADEVSHLIEKINDPHHHGRGRLVYSSEPAELVSKLVAMIEADRANVKVAEPVGE